MIDDNVQVDNDLFPILNASSNPFIAAVHFFFKAGILAVYLIIPLFTQ